MRDMFDSYSNLSDIYVPDNTTNRPNSFVYFEDSKVKKEYNIKGELIGYSWGYGETVSLVLSMAKVIYVEDDALVFTEENEAPTTETVGVKGQRAYNTKSIKSWTCETLDQATYNWVEDKVFKYPESGTKEIVLDTFPDISLQNVLFTIKNFRKEVVYSKEIPGGNTLVINIDKELAEILLQGVYTCYVSVSDNSFTNVCFKFTIIIKDACSFNNNCGSVINGEVNV
jgi:hypothetical protein